MRINLNLATRPFSDLGPAMKRLRIAMGVMAFASVVFGLGIYLLHHKAEEARARAHSLDGKIVAVMQERDGYESLMRQPENAQLLVQVGSLNQLFDKKAFSWTLAMEDLETVMPGGVQVSSLEPIVDEKTGKILLHLRVIGPRDRAVDMVRNLEHSKRFIFPSITGENAESNGGPGEKLEPVSASNRFNFDVQAQFTPPTPDDLKKAAKPEKRAPAEQEVKVPTAHPAAGAKPKPNAGLTQPVPARPAQRPPQGFLAPGGPRQLSVPGRPAANGPSFYTGVAHPLAAGQPPPRRLPTPAPTGQAQPRQGGPQ
jgi:type IV pilus assembly protein PilN